MAMKDHEIFSVTWSDVGSDPMVEGGEVVDAAGFQWSPLVQAPGHVAPNGDVMFKSGGLRMLNKTEHYRCKEQTVVFKNMSTLLRKRIIFTIGKYTLYLPLKYR